MKCALCIGRFHYQCLNMDKEQFSAQTREYRSAWLCPNCTNVTKRNRSTDSTPVRQQNSLMLGADMDMSCDNIPDYNTTSLRSPCSVAESSSALMSASGDVTMDKISVLLDEKLNASLSLFMNSFRQALREDVKNMVKTEMELVVKNIKDEFSSTTDFICAEQTSLRTDMEKSADKIRILESEKSDLQAEIVRLETRVASIEKISRSCNIELQAIPERKNENILFMLKKIGEAIKVPIEDSTISACRRVAKYNPTSNRPRNVVVTFTTPRLRDLVLSAVHRFNKAHPDRGLTSVDLDIPGETRKIYVTEHLSLEQKMLHAATRKTAKEFGYKFVWVRYGQIYARKDESSAAILIKNLESLSRMRL